MVGGNEKIPKISIKFINYNMVEGPSNLVTRGLLNTSDLVSNYNTHHVVEVSGNKCQLGEGEQEFLTKLNILEDAGKEVIKHKKFYDLSLSRNPTKDHNLATTKSNSSLLFDQLSWELSISCLVWCMRSDYSTLALLNKNFRSLVKSGLLYQLRRKLGNVESWVYFSCSPLEWEVFDPNRSRWMSLPKMPENECFMCSDKESLSVGTELLIFGKDLMSQIIYKYSILSNTWSSGMSMATPRCLFASASLGEIAIFTGGCDPHGKTLSLAELYNSETGQWEILPRMNKARKMCSGFTMDGKFYVIGGIGIGNTMQCGEEFDLTTKTWHLIPNMTPRRRDGVVNRTSPATEAPPLVAVVNNVLYAADYAQQVVRRYTKDQNSWIIVGGLPEEVASFNGWGIAFRACGDLLIVIGGPKECAMDRKVLEVHACAPSEGVLQWKLLAQKQSANFVYNCTVMGC